MNYEQIRRLNELWAWKTQISDEIQEIRAKIGELGDNTGNQGSKPRGPVPGMKALIKRVERLESALK